jgi:hypothetical protein
MVLKPIIVKQLALYAQSAIIVVVSRASFIMFFDCLQRLVI